MQVSAPLPGPQHLFQGYSLILLFSTLSPGFPLGLPAETPEEMQRQQHDRHYLPAVITYSCPSVATRYWDSVFRITIGIEIHGCSVPYIKCLSADTQSIHTHIHSHTEWKRERTPERDLPSTNKLPRQSQQPQPVCAETRIQQLRLGLPCRWQGPKTLESSSAVFSRPLLENWIRSKRIKFKTVAI